jgi:hypothetical protein
LDRLVLRRLEAFDLALAQGCSSRRGGTANTAQTPDATAPWLAVALGLPLELVAAQPRQLDRIVCDILCRQAGTALDCCSEAIRRTQDNKYAQMV